MEEKKKKTFAGVLGSIIANTVVVCVSTCLLSILFAVTWRVVGWILRFGGII